MRSVLFATLLFGAACSVPAQADQLAPSPASLSAPRIAVGVAPAKVRAPYDVQIMRESGETLPTYAHRDRFYVQGNAGERYVIRITNPTANRIEAVVSVDGLDVVDGESGDLRKRGYVVPPYGETRIEGFRTSTEDVATFRFSSVDDSYAGKKGKARNVGVIAVALFEEQQIEPQQIIVTEPTLDDGYRAPYDYEADIDARGADANRRDSGPSREKLSKAPADRPARTRTIAPTTTGGAPAPTSIRPPSAPPPEPRAEKKAFDEDAAGDMTMESELGGVASRQQRTERPGLGTEFGEQRHSAASFTKFVRAAGRPIAIAELRYNDMPGLIALGIPVAPLPDEGEIMTRETADPFPGDSRFSQAP